MSCDSDDLNQYNREYWDTVCSGYDDLYHGPWSQWEDRLLAKEIGSLKFKSEMVRVLDLGCGTGLGFAICSACFPNFQYTGVDVSEGMLAKFRSKHSGVELHCVDALEGADSFEDMSFDFIMSINSAASFIGHPESIRDSFSAKLAVGGKFFLSFLNRYSLRRVLSFNLAEVENYRTRGDTGNEYFTRPVATSVKQLREVFSQEEFLLHRIYHQSVLGGVWETQNSIYVEKILHQMVASLGHYVNIVGERVCANGPD